MNRATKRALERAGVPLPPAAATPRPAGMDLVFPAIIAAATGDCQCKPCRLLRRAGQGIAEIADEEDDDGGGG